LTDINAELPEELGTLLGGDTGSLGTVTTVSAQNGISGSSSGGDSLQPTQMLDMQNHQQLSQLLSGNTIAAAPMPSASSYGVPASSVALSRHAGIGIISAMSPATNIAIPGGSRPGSVPGGIVTTLGQVTNNIVTLSRQGNITLVPTAGGGGGGGAPGVNTAVIGGHRVPAPSQQQQLVAINTGVGNAGATLLSVSSPNTAATMARLQPMSSSNIGAAVMSLTAAGMVINVSQNQPGLTVSANGSAHIGPTLVMPQRFSNAAVQQQNIIDGNSGNLAGVLTNPAQMAMPTVAVQQMGTRVCHHSFPSSFWLLSVNLCLQRC